MTRRSTLALPLLCLAAAAAAILGACSGGGGSTVACTDGSTLTYTTFGQAFMTSYCVSCHGGARTEAGLNLGTQAVIQARPSQISSVAGQGRSMPPSGSPTPTDAERAQLTEWLACCAP